MQSRKSRNLALALGVIGISAFGFALVVNGAGNVTISDMGVTKTCRECHSGNLFAAQSCRSGFHHIGPMALAFSCGLNKESTLDLCKNLDEISAENHRAKASRSQKASTPAATVSASTEAAATEPEPIIELGKVDARSTGSIDVTFTIINNGARKYRWINLECALLDEKGVPVAIYNPSVDNVPSNSRAYGSALFITPPSTWKTPTCRITNLHQ